MFHLKKAVDAKVSAWKKEVMEKLKQKKEEKKAELKVQEEDDTESE